MEIEVYDLCDDLYGIIDWYECRHINQYRKNGELCCADCNCFYNENTLEWEDRKF